MEKRMIDFAINYYEENKGFILEVIDSTYDSVMPLDVNVREWKPEHWRWFMKRHIQEDWAKVSAAEFGLKYGMSEETAHRMFVKDRQK